MFKEIVKEMWGTLSPIMRYMLFFVLGMITIGVILLIK